MSLKLSQGLIQGVFHNRDIVALDVSTRSNGVPKCDVRNHMLDRNVCKQCKQCDCVLHSDAKRPETWHFFMSNFITHNLN